jgi:hypothetical protein
VIDKGENMSIYYSDQGNRKRKRKTNKGANEQFESIVKDTINFTYNIPMPPTNPDGTFKSLDQLVRESEYKEWEAVRKDQIKKSIRDALDANDPEQVMWVKEQNSYNDMYGWKHKMTSILSVLIPLIIVLTVVYFLLAPVN